MSLADAQQRSRRFSLTDAQRQSERSLPTRSMAKIELVTAIQKDEKVKTCFSNGVCAGKERDSSDAKHGWGTKREREAIKDVVVTFNHMLYVFMYV